MMQICVHMCISFLWSDVASSSLIKPLFHVHLYVCLCICIYNWSKLLSQRKNMPSVLTEAENYFIGWKKMNNILRGSNFTHMWCFRVLQPWNYIFMDNALWNFRNPCIDGKALKVFSYFHVIHSIAHKRKICRNVLREKREVLQAVHPRELHLRPI